jgi:hypothetical protein
MSDNEVRFWFFGIATLSYILKGRSPFFDAIWTFIKVFLMVLLIILGAGALTSGIKGIFKK